MALTQTGTDERHCSLACLIGSFAVQQVDMPWAILRTLGYDDELEWEVRAGMHRCICVLSCGRLACTHT